MASIYNITSDLKQIYEKLESGECIDQETGEIEPEIINQLSITKEELQQKSIDYAYVIKSLDDNLDAYDKEIKRLQEQKKRIENAKQRMIEIVSNAMLDFGIVEVKGDTLKLNFRTSETVEVFDELLLDDKYKRVKVEPDKVAIRKALKNGEEVQGARLLENKNLQIK